MRLESWEELEETNPVFCEVCGIPLNNPEERHGHVCTRCKKQQQQVKKDDEFICWICGKHLRDFNEIATGLCPSCRSSILRKIK